MTEVKTTEQDRERGMELASRVVVWVRDNRGEVPTEGYPLPWYAHENSVVLEVAVDDLRLFFTAFKVVRGDGVLRLQFVWKGV